MDIISLNADAAAIFIDARELDDAGLTPQQLECESASRLVDCVLGDSGLALDGALEIEAFAGSGGVMLFARAIQASRVFCLFDDLESLCAAAVSLPQGTGSLCYIEGRWCLILRGCERFFSGMLSEFSCLEVRSAAYEDYLAEHGALVFPARATERLLEYYPPSAGQS